MALIEPLGFADSSLWKHNAPLSSQTLPELFLPRTSTQILTWRARWFVAENHLGSCPWEKGFGRALYFFFFRIIFRKNIWQVIWWTICLSTLNLSQPIRLIFGDKLPPPLLLYVNCCYSLCHWFIWSDGALPKILWPDGFPGIFDRSGYAHAVTTARNPGVRSENFPWSRKNDPQVQNKPSRKSRIMSAALSAQSCTATKTQKPI